MYPKLMCYGGLVVRIDSVNGTDGSGECLRAGDGHKVGFKSTTWNMSVFKDYTGDLRYILEDGKEKILFLNTKNKPAYSVKLT